jgi:hypothetical protein
MCDPGSKVKRVTVLVLRTGQGAVNESEMEVAGADLES